MLRFGRYGKDYLMATVEIFKYKICGDQCADFILWVGWDIATPLAATRTIAEKNLKENIKPGNTAKRTVGGVPTALTVGFSGTNDNRTLLPLNIVQNDLPGLSHTNAEVLTYLLQPRNRNYIPAWDDRGKRLSEGALLHKLKDNGIRMLLDAGAQILELDNISLARVWLEVDSQAEAAVFFGEDERARVVYRDNKVQPLAASPFNDNLGSCVVYLVSLPCLRMIQNVFVLLDCSLVEGQNYS